MALLIHVVRHFLVFLLLWGLTSTRFWDVIEFNGFDALTVITAPGQSPLPIIVVGIDDSSIQKLRQPWPWPRSLHAELIDQLHAQGAAVVAFDIPFHNPTTPEHDAALKKAIAKAGNVVLIASLTRQNGERGNLWSRVDPYSAFTDAGAKVGLAQIEFEHDMVVRRFPLAVDSFWKEILFHLQRKNPEIDFDSTLTRNHLIRFFGPDHSVPYVSYARVLGHGKPIPPGTFEGALVLVGRDTQGLVDVGSAQADMFATPFTAFNGKLTPGIEIHASLIHNAATRSSVAEAPYEIRVGLLLMVAWFSAFVPRQFRLLRSGLSTTALCLGLVGTSYVLFTYFNFWLPVVGGIALAITSYLIQALQAYVDETRNKSRIRTAFSLFVPTAVADRMAAQSTVLEPGGEELELSSMFTDLAGFTSISEQLSPTQVAQLLNFYFDQMTEIIFRHGGTVQGYLGDGVFAFWGAPVPDAGHRSRAVSACCELVAAENAINAKLQAKGLPAVHTRIGLHSGMAMVGNFGSKVRFNYTALGDTINLSSRLEGLNKRYGTPMLISAETYAGLTESKKNQFRRVEKVRVKGRDKPVEVYTPCADVEVIEISNRAIDLFLARRWAESEQLWHTLLQHQSTDPIAHYYLHRIMVLQAQGDVGEDWDGIVSISEK
ncbi:MAG: hypothetical protein RIR79_1768 [Pseudomonadota bacterium]|jgi:adenylate cyclase